MKSYKLNSWKPVKMVSENKGNTINDDGNGWYNQDLRQFIKISWKKENNEWVAIEGATKDEIDSFQKQKQLEQIADFRQRAKADGQECYNNYDVEITAQLFGKPAEIVNPVVADIDENLMPILNLVKDGQWYSAMTRIVSLQPLTTSIAENLRQDLRLKIINYVQENYS